MANEAFEPIIAFAAALELPNPHKNARLTDEWILSTCRTDDGPVYLKVGDIRRAAEAAHTLG